MTSIHAHTLFDTSSKRQKEAESAQIASDIAKFESSGGKIQVLGDTKFTEKSKTLRQVFQEGGKQKEKRG